MKIQLIKKSNSFQQEYIDQLHNAIEGTSLGPTVSLCHHCHKHIPALRYHLNNKVYIAKNCTEHGISHHMIESDYEFYSNLYYTQDNPQFNFNGGVLIEGSDRCNLECPHCYHLPDNKIKDPSIESILDQIRAMPLGEDQVHKIILAGAESTLRPDFCELITAIKELDPCLDVTVMTNGIRFADIDFVKRAKAAGLSSVNVGLNHKDYIDHETIRRKQIAAIKNLHEEQIHVTYISYTMVDQSELDDILTEITSSFWQPKNFRIRHGAEVGRNSSKTKPFVSDLYRAVEEWCVNNNKPFERIIEADNNIYHVMVKIEDKVLRLISWCDEENIDMEELRSGPWCNFVPDGITNFLHQIIRRDIWKNNGIILPDMPPDRYKFNRTLNDSKLDLLSL
jgi:MoaA/NifB/PqqE/SkfB family radical SAM enzyme